MTQKIKETIDKLQSILMTALLAGLVAFVQSLIANNGACTMPAINPESTAIIGAGLRTGYLAIKSHIGIM